MKRCMVKKEAVRETKNSSYIKVDKDLIRWAINRTARLRESNDADLNDDHMNRLQDQFSDLIEQLTISKILLAKIANGDGDTEVYFTSEQSETV